MRIGRSTLVATIATTVLSLVPSAPAQAAPVDIADQLAAIPGMTVVSEQPAPGAGFRFFFLTYRQPADHTNPRGGTFEQRLQLLHRDVNRPMILHTTGYDMPEFAFRSEPTQLVDGNQISVEERFFTPSRPNPANWKKLDIWQAATDHHRITEALKTIYTRKWIATGASKGGMTSVYHRRFYPRDLDGVVAYVAPNDVDNADDHAYDDFFDSVGSTPACQDSLEAIQREALTRRTDMVNRLQAQADANGWTFDQVFGTADKAFEMSVLDLAWTFWQYSLESDCGQVPSVTASSDEIYTFFDSVIGMGFYADQGILSYAPYFYQAATQLGWPQPKFRELKDLLHYPNLYVANSSLPVELRSKFDEWPISDVDNWVRTSASQMLFVYGSNDPWGAEPFHPSNKDSYTYTAPGWNHGSNIARLNPADAAAARATVQRWAGVPATAPSPRSALDSRNPDLERRPI
ncbi:S28 family serine protease [Actinophytocola oryzae]|uniref:PS-10 peptidase S37 n=1 Tax=Actinophytocola oryzae TaxID=502181 RepID=A0A4R7V7K2_9PSEU|nr:S28 family serine protease [Actinophytocola oryzae]TDV44867.1 PS-10 peptidase S37 [Actinophytocola oryzae]